MCSFSVPVTEEPRYQGSTSRSKHSRSEHILRLGLSWSVSQVYGRVVGYLVILPMKASRQGLDVRYGRNVLCHLKAGRVDSGHIITHDVIWHVSRHSVWNVCTVQ